MAKLGERPGVALDPGRGFAVDLPPRFEKLKPGPGLPAEEVLADQRRRLHGATIALVDTAGWSNVRVRSLARAAGVSTATFYKHFLDADDCLASTFEALLAKALRACRTAQRRQRDWRDALQATVATFFEQLAADPRAARLVLVEIYAGGPRARRRIGQSVDELERLVSASFTGAPKGMKPPRHLVAGMTAGFLRVARTTTLAGRVGDLPGLANEVCDWLLSLPSTDVLSLLAADVGIVERSAGEGSFAPVTSESQDPRVTLDDRERLLRAAHKIAAAEGFSSLTVPRLRLESGVSRRRFDAIFTSVDECFLESVERVALTAAGDADSWSTSATDWSHRTCRVVLALCAQAARRRVEARLAFLGIFATGRTGLLWRERTIGRLATELRATVPLELRPSQVVAEASTAAGWHIVQSDIAARRARGLPRVAPLLSYLLLAPMIGSAAASEAISSSNDGMSR
jgi:AcrR family transcriptional regulator